MTTANDGFKLINDRNLFEIYGELERMFAGRPLEISAGSWQNGSFIAEGQPLNGRIVCISESSPTGDGSDTDRIGEIEIRDPYSTIQIYPGDKIASTDTQVFMRRTSGQGIRLTLAA